MKTVIELMLFLQNRYVQTYVPTVQYVINPSKMFPYVSALIVKLKINRKYSSGVYRTVYDL